MASETFVSAMMLITGVVAAAILIVAVLPVIWSMVGTVSSASATTDRAMRTDFKIVTTFADYTAATTSGATFTVWMKNIGTARISTLEIDSGSDVFVGRSDAFTKSARTSGVVPRSTTSQWNYTLYNLVTGTSAYWDPGETLQVDAFSSTVTAAGQPVYFQFSLPSAVSRSAEFTAI